MSAGFHIAFFGSSLVSAYWNGAATYYRGLLRALAGRGHRVSFYEPDAYDRQRHRDIPDPPWAEVTVYSGSDPAGAEGAVASARGADVLVKASGVGVFDDLLEEAVLAARRPGGLAVLWDVDAPATLARIEAAPRDPLRDRVPRFDMVLTYGGGAPVVDAYERLGARLCAPIYNALDPDTHYKVAPRADLTADLTLIANRLPDREARIEAFFLRPAAALRDRAFRLGGSGWGDRPMPGNVRYGGHVTTADHNAWNCSARAVLNVSRASMAETGFSPATRVFEAAGAAACVITDAWAGIGDFFEPGAEILVAASGEEVAGILQGLSRDQAARIGVAARRRALADHTYGARALDVEAALREGRARPRARDA